MAIAGGPLGGVLVAYAKLTATAWADALTFAVVLVVLVRIRTRGVPALGPTLGGPPVQPLQPVPDTD